VLTYTTSRLILIWFSNIHKGKLFREVFFFTLFICFFVWNNMSFMCLHFTLYVFWHNKQQFFIVYNFSLKLDGKSCCVNTPSTINYNVWKCKDKVKREIRKWMDFGFADLMPLSTIFQLYLYGGEQYFSYIFMVENNISVISLWSILYNRVRH